MSSMSLLEMLEILQNLDGLFCNILHVGPHQDSMKGLYHTLWVRCTSVAVTVFSSHCKHRKETVTKFLFPGAKNLFIGIVDENSWTNFCVTDWLPHSDDSHKNISMVRRGLKICSKLGLKILKLNRKCWVILREIRAENTSKKEGTAKCLP